MFVPSVQPVDSLIERSGAQSKLYFKDICTRVSSASLPSLSSCLP
jgi:hypothetical protein